LSHWYYSTSLGCSMCQIWTFSLFTLPLTWNTASSLEAIHSWKLSSSYMLTFQYRYSAIMSWPCHLVPAATALFLASSVAAYLKLFQFSCMAAIINHWHISLISLSWQRMLLKCVPHWPPLFLVCHVLCWDDYRHMLFLWTYCTTGRQSPCWVVWFGFLFGMLAQQQLQTVFCETKSQSELSVDLWKVPSWPVLHVPPYWN
jgi:hypothetical protein